MKKPKLSAAQVKVLQHINKHGKAPFTHTRYDTFLKLVDSGFVKDGKTTPAGRDYLAQLEGKDDA